MNLRCKKPRPLAREELFRNPRIRIRVLPTQAGLSSPEHVLRRLDEFRKEFELMEEDELWLMLDTDHWVEPNHIANFNDVCTQAAQKGFQLAHSNPCFEIWLLLHVTDLRAGDNFERCGEVVERLKDVLGEYSKRSVDPSRFSKDSIAVAIGRAESLDTSPVDRWPQKNGSHVYKLVKKLL